MMEKEERTSHHDKFYEDIRQYLSEKFKDCPITDVEEAAAMIGCKALFLTNEVLAERDRVWEKHVDREFKQWEKNQDTILRAYGVKPNKGFDDSKYVVTCQAYTNMKGDEG